MYKDAQGRYLTQALFWETSDPASRQKYPPVFSLSNEDKHGCVSMQRLYMAMEDVEEYYFVMETLGAWEHWEKLCSLSWFQDYLDKWRKQLELKLRSKALKHLVSIADQSESDSQRVSAAKFLAKGEWKSSPSKRGRPSKEEVEGRIKQEASLDQEIEDDIARIRIDQNL